MRDYEEFPDTLGLNSLYFIGNPQSLTVETLKELHDFFLSKKQFFSLEKLIKEKEKAHILYGPGDLEKNFPELNLIEVEDYLGSEKGYDAESEKKVSVNQSLSWLIDPKNNSKKGLVVNDELKNLTVGEDQKVFVQSVLMPAPGPKPVFQSTLRVMVVDPDPIKKVELAKKINQLITAATGLNKHEDNYPETKKYESYKLRSFIPKEVAEFPLSGDEIISLIT